MNRPAFQRCALREIPSVAEGGGFEPPVREPVRQFSKLLVSATHPSFQKEVLNCNRGVISLIAGAKVHTFSETTKSFHHFFRKKLFEGYYSIQIGVKIEGFREFEGVFEVAHPDIQECAALAFCRKLRAFPEHRVGLHVLAQGQQHGVADHSGGVEVGERTDVDLLCGVRLDEVLHQAFGLILLPAGREKQQSQYY